MSQPFTTRTTKPPHVVPPVLACRMLIGACNLMVCPINQFINSRLQATYLADRVVVFDGTPAVSTCAHTPQSLLTGTMTSTSFYCYVSPRSFLPTHRCPRCHPPPKNTIIILKKVVICCVARLE